MLVSETVTVILRAHPAYTRFLPRALASLAEQEFRDFLVFILFDGQPDERELNEAIEPTLGKVRGHVVVQPEPTGYYAVPCNRAIPHVATPWIAFMDADNEFAPDHLLNLVRAVREQDARPAFAYSRRRYVADPGFEGEPPALGESPFVPWNSEAIARLLNGPSHNFIDSGDLLIGKGTLYWLAKETGAFFSPELRRFGDWDMARRLALIGAPGAAVDAATNIYHWHGENIQLTRKPEVLSMPETVVEDLLSRNEKGTGR